MAEMKEENGSRKKKTKLIYTFVERISLSIHLGPVVQSVSLTSSLGIISLTVLADSIHIILIFFAEKM